MPSSSTWSVAAVADRIALASILLGRLQQGARSGTLPTGRSPETRWALLGGVLVTELIAFKLTFRPWLSPSRVAFLEAALGSIVVAAFLGGWTAHAPAERRATGPRRWRPWFLGHLLATAGLWAITAFGIQQGARSSGGGVWLTAWAACLVLAFALWLGALVPPREWGLRERRTWLAVIAGLATGGSWLLLRFHAHVWIHAWHQERLLTLLATVLRLLGHEVVLDTRQAIIGTPSFNAVAGSRCMGYEGVILVSLFTGIYLWLSRRQLRFPRAFLLVPFAAAVSYGLNVVRIIALIEIGMRWPAIALGGFHSVAGWYSVSAVSLGVVVASQRLCLRAVGATAPAARSDTSAGFYLAPVLAILATAMLTQVVSTGFDALYPLRVIACAVPLWLHRGRLGTLGWNGSAWAIPVGIAIFAMWMLLERPATASPTAAGLAGLPAGASIAWLALRTVGSVVTVPIAEELAFRGYLLRKLCATDFERVPLDRFTWLSFVASSFLFGALHGRWLAGTVAGMIFALTLYRRGRLADPIVAHATANALIAITVLVGGRWNLWE